ncbi:MAG: DUF2179 domain-containing protein, partial [Aliifodinibius sp.]|nr:DUF2179 domain-containing protein [Fodinibius sp.]NIW79435.1 DUF2179 domain-containing protein [Calditrichia bacterium]
GVTLVEGEGLTGPVKIIFTIIKRKALREVINTVTEHDPKAFYSVEDVVTAKEGSFALAQSERKRFYRHMFKMDRKRK